jgi:hypothetical protein
VKRTPRDHATGDARNHEGCEWRRGRDQSGKHIKTKNPAWGLGDRQEGNSQVALGAVRAPAEVMLKVLARRARALLEDVARHHVFLVLRVPVHALGLLRRWESRRRAEEERRVGGVGRVGVRRCKSGHGCTMSHEGREVRLVVRAEGVAWYELWHRDYWEYGGEHGVGERRRDKK